MKNKKPQSEDQGQKSMPEDTKFTLYTFVKDDGTRVNVYGPPRQLETWEKALLSEARAWFAAHPSRGFRIRKAHPQEIGTSHIVLKRVGDLGHLPGLPLAAYNRHQALMLDQCVALQEGDDDARAWVDCFLAVLWTRAERREDLDIPLIILQADAMHQAAEVAQ